MSGLFLLPRKRGNKLKNLRFFVEKKPGFDWQAQRLLSQFRDELGIKHLQAVRLLSGYDVFAADISEDHIEKIKTMVLSELVTDDIYTDIKTALNIDNTAETLSTTSLQKQQYFAVEYLAGQFDQRADSAQQCIELLLPKEQCMDIKSFKVIVANGDISQDDINKIKRFYINPIESQEKDLSVLERSSINVNNHIEVYQDFLTMDNDALDKLKDKLNLSMNYEDFHFIQRYYREENRCPTEIEIKVFDTYWSDHCRHTTFATQINHISFPDTPFGQQMQAEFAHYLAIKSQLTPNKGRCLMDMATIMAKYLRRTGHLDNWEISDENNACSIFVDVDAADFDGNKSTEKWLLMFKNETHNHPTEIEPFGGASTCLGGAIRDPLSGRAYVYQAIRVSGSANPLGKIEDTLPGKLSQRKITTEAAEGYSSYGNQIGIATSLVSELYHQGYQAKRLEVGAVVAAAPVENVRRDKPQPGDRIILLGGKTGRDGCGGASGSSKEHNDDSLLLCGAEVQKGNAPEERKIQRLFRNAEATKLIKKCNDFGAGGVCVAIGELADGVEVNLDLIPVKYQGLSGTELAISESQERMAVIVADEDSQAFLAHAAAENLLATVVGEVTEKARLILKWQNREIVNIKRAFLNTNGVIQCIDITVSDPEKQSPFVRKPQGNTLAERWHANITDLNVASQKGLGEMFDATVGAGTILMPYGGKYQMTPIDVSIVKLPMLDKDTDTVSAITWGFNPDLLSWSPYHGSMYAVIDSLAKLVCAGIDYKRARLSFQEYFQKLGKDSKAWAKPFLALLGAIRAQNDFQVAAIGGKDSMSGTFNDLTVPPTFISFAVATGNVKQVISPEFKQAGSFVYLLDNPLAGDGGYDADELKANFECVLTNIYSGNILSAMTVKHGGVAEALCKMSFGNRIGVDLSENNVDYFAIKPAGIVIESRQAIQHNNAILLGKTTDEFNIVSQQERIDLKQLQMAWLGKLAKIFPASIENEGKIYADIDTGGRTRQGRGEQHAGSGVCGQANKHSEHRSTRQWPRAAANNAKPRVLIATFPGTNSEYDMYNIFNRNGAKANMLLFRNIRSDYIRQSIKQIADELKQTQIFVLPGGFSAGDEPDGSGKFIASILQNPIIKDSINEFLARDGLILGICNGFQALVKSGLLPNGDIGRLTLQSPTLTSNQIGRHISQMVKTKVVNNRSPWLSSFAVGQIFTIPVSHGEGRFYANKKTLQRLIDNRQIATQYVDFSGDASNEFMHNPNASSLAIEGIISADGRIFGKMGHSERYSKGTFKNIVGDKEQNIFVNGINYFN